VRGKFNLGHIYGSRLDSIDEGPRSVPTTTAREWTSAKIFAVILESALKANLGVLARTVGCERR
jgi:hypothetical protein